MMVSLLADIHIAGFDRQSATVRHRVPRVYCKVQYYLFDLAGISLYASKIWVQKSVEFDILADQARQHLCHVQNYRVDIQNLWLQHLPPAKSQKLPRKRARPVARFLYLLDISSQWVGCI
jgi:hypothetical protein